MIVMTSAIPLVETSAKLIWELKEAMKVHLFVIIQSRYDLINLFKFECRKNDL